MVNYTFYPGIPTLPQQTLASVSIEENEWRWNKEAKLFVPVWFKGIQLPHPFQLRERLEQ